MPSQPIPSALHLQIKQNLQTLHDFYIFVHKQQSCLLSFWHQRYKLSVSVKTYIIRFVSADWDNSIHTIGHNNYIVYVRPKTAFFKEKTFTKFEKQMYLCSTEKDLNKVSYELYPKPINQHNIANLKIHINSLTGKQRLKKTKKKC